jgi:hypothetical protein
VIYFLSPPVFIKTYILFYKTTRMCLTDKRINRTVQIAIC